MTVRTCPACGGRDVERSAPSVYRYRDSGLGTVTLHGGVHQIKCRTCGQTSIHVDREQQLLQVIALMLLLKPGHLTGREMRYLRSAGHLSQAQLALRLDVRRETVAEREGRESLGLDAGAEFFLRVVLLQAFLERLKTDDHLEPEHHRILSDHCRTVFDLSNRVAEHGRKRSIQVHQVDNIWEPELAIA